MNAARTTIAFLSASMLAIGLAHGGIVYSPVNVSLSAYGGLTLDLNHDGTADFILGFAANNTARPYITNAVVTGFTNSVLSASANQGLPLTAAGTTIDASYQSAQWVGFFNRNAGGTTVGSWTAAGNVEGYVGLRQVTSGGTNYGWAHFIYNSTNTPPNDIDTGTLTLLDAAMETSVNTSIQTGQTAESGALAMQTGPSSQTGCLGSNLRLTVAAPGNPAPTFRWQAGAPGSGIYTNLALSSRVSSTTISSAGAMAALSIHSLNYGDIADYIVIASNAPGASGSVTSTVPANVTVLANSDSPATLTHRYSFHDPPNPNTTIADSVGGSAWNGTVQGTGWTLTGARLVLNGTAGTYASLPAGIIGNYTALTVEFWALLNTANPTWTRVWAFGDRSGNNKHTGVDFSPFATNTAEVLDFKDASGASAYAHNSSNILSATVYAHVTVVVDPVNNSMCYYDGPLLVSKLRGRVPVLTNIIDSLNWIGASLYTTNSYLSAVFSEFRIYRGALPASAVALNDAVGAANYIQVSANPTISASLSGGNTVLSWPLTDAGFLVQSSTNLVTGIGWTTLANQPVVVGGTTWQVTLPTSTPRFLRLVTRY